MNMKAKKKKKENSIPPDMIPVINDAKRDWVTLETEDRKIWLDRARTARIRRGRQLENRAFSMFLEEFLEFRRLSGYRDGAEGMIAWTEANVKFKVSVTEDDIPVDRWVYAKDLPDERDEYGRSYAVMWERAKDELRIMLEMKKGVYVRNLNVLCWPRGEGKSFIVCLVALHRLFTFQYSKIFLLGSSKDQSENSLLDEIKKIIKNSPKLFAETNGEKGLQAEKIILKKSVNYMKQLSTHSTLVSNASMVIHTEAFEMENEKIFEDWYSSLRNTVNSMGLIDSTVSRPGHWLHGIWEGYKKKPDGRTYFSYRYSKNADPADYWHPINTEIQLESYARTMSISGFAKRFKNLWETFELNIFKPYAIRAMEFIGTAGTVHINPEERHPDILKQIETSELQEVSRIIPGRMVDRVSSGGGGFEELVRVDSIYSLGEHMKNQNPDDNIVTGSKIMTSADIKRLTAEFETHWALLYGTDMADAVVPDDRINARSTFVALLKGLPGSLNMSKFQKSETDIKYLYFLANVSIIKDNQPWTMAETARRVKNSLGHVDMMTGENHAITPVIAMCKNLGIPQIVVNQNRANQAIAMNEIITAVNTGRFKSPRVPVYGSRSSDILREEMNALDVVDEKKGIQKIQSRYKTIVNGARDDVWDALCWAAYGGLKITAVDFRERRFVSNTPVFGIFSGMPQFQGMFSNQFGLEEFNSTIH